MGCEMGIVEALAAALAVVATVAGLCWLRIRCMPEPVYDLPRWWYMAWIVWLPRLTGQSRHR